MRGRAFGFRISLPVNPQGRVSGASGGGSVPTPPAGTFLLVDQDGTYLTDPDGTYLTEPM